MEVKVKFFKRLDHRNCTETLCELIINRHGRFNRIFARSMQNPKDRSNDYIGELTAFKRAMVNVNWLNREQRKQIWNSFHENHKPKRTNDLYYLRNLLDDSYSYIASSIQYTSSPPQFTVSYFPVKKK